MLPESPRVGAAKPWVSSWAVWIVISTCPRGWTSRRRLVRLPRAASGIRRGLLRCSGWWYAAWVATRAVASCAPARVWVRWRRMSLRRPSFEAVGKLYRGAGLVGCLVPDLCTRSGLVWARILLPTEKNAVPSIGERCRMGLSACKLLGVRGEVLWWIRSRRVTEPVTRVSGESKTRAIE